VPSGSPSSPSAAPTPTSRRAGATDPAGSTAADDRAELPRGTRRVRRRALSLAAALLAPAGLASCSSGAPEGDPASRTGGESFEQRCADGRPSLIDVAAHRRGGAVVVTWGMPRVVAEPHTYRVQRRGAGERWVRLVENAYPPTPAPLRRRRPAHRLAA